MERDEVMVAIDGLLEELGSVEDTMTASRSCFTTVKNLALGHSWGSKLLHILWYCMAPMQTCSSMKNIKFYQDLHDNDDTYWPSIWRSPHDFSESIVANIAAHSCCPFSGVPSQVLHHVAGI